MTSTSPFPPSFDGNPWTYGFALFGLTLISALSLTQLLAYWGEGRQLRMIYRLIQNEVPPAPPVPPLSILGAYQRIIANFLLMAFLGATPDVFILLTWGEAGAPMIEILYLIDRLGDGLCMVPFLNALWLMVRTREALPQQLAKVVDIPLGPFRWTRLGQNLQIFIIVLLIAIGVTLGKASA
jgi:hypothetical protein